MPGELDDVRGTLYQHRHGIFNGVLIASWVGALFGLWLLISQLADISTINT